MKDKVSVALCTYNAELYLKEQLESIFKQTRLPDEIVVCDDCSTDSSLKILNDFRKISPVPFKIYVNEKNLGVSKNFEKAISLCSGDIIFPSDADDVWLPEKLEKLVRVLDSNKDCSYVFSDAYVVDENLNTLGYTMWERISFNRFQRLKFIKGKQLEVLLKHNVVSGATMAFRSYLRKLFLPIPEIWIHDGWIALLGSAVSRGCFIEEPLIYYRQHNHQMIGAKRKYGIKDKIIKKIFGNENSVHGYKLELEKCKVVRSRLLSFTRNKIEKIDDKIYHFQRRIKVNEDAAISGLIIIANEFFSGRYFEYSGGLVSVVKDTFIVFKNIIKEKAKRDTKEEN